MDNRGGVFSRAGALALTSQAALLSQGGRPAQRCRRDAEGRQPRQLFLAA
ncbi:hypothetical protein ACPA9J_17160 [Pseudomonas aeruginosa]